MLKISEVDEPLDSRKERDRQIVLLARMGKSYAEIGKIYGLTRARVSQICLNYGLVNRPNDINLEYWKFVWAEQKKSA